MLFNLISIHFTHKYINPDCMGLWQKNVYGNVKCIHSSLFCWITRYPADRMKNIE